MPGISGRIAEASRLGLEDLLKRQLLKEKLEQQRQQQATENEMRTRQIGQQDRALDLRVSEASRSGEQFERTRRDRANEVGLEQMGRDRKVLDEETETRDLKSAQDVIANDPSLPPSVRRLIGLKRAGISATPSAEMLMTPEEQESDFQRDLKRATAIAGAQARESARYRAPKDTNYERIESVDEAGNPVVQFMTPEEVRAKGGVKGAPKTTAKAQGPAVVDAVLNEIDTLSKRINTGGANIMTKVGGLVRRGAGSMNLDNDVAEYESLVKGFTPIVARAVGHTGVLTEQDVQSVRALFPQPGDSQTLAQNKLKRVRELMQSMQPDGAPRGTAPKPGGEKPAFRFNPQTGKLEPVK